MNHSISLMSGELCQTKDICTVLFPLKYVLFHKALTAQYKIGTHKINRFLCLPDQHDV